MPYTKVGDPILVGEMFSRKKNITIDTINNNVFDYLGKLNG